MLSLACLVASEEAPLAFNFEKIQKSFYSTVVEFDGIYSENTTAKFFNSRVFAYRTNSTKRIEIGKKRFGHDQVYNVNMTENQINFYNQDHEFLFPLMYYALDQNSIIVKGTTNEDIKVNGLIYAGKTSIITLRYPNSDKVLQMRFTPEKELTTGEWLQKLSPGIAIIFFLGFGRQYRNRFWKQFNSMNTRTLSRRINEAKEN